MMCGRRSVLGQWVELVEGSPCSLPGSQGEKLGFIPSVNSKILLQMSGIVFFPHLLSFVFWGPLFFFFRNTFEGLSELEGRVSAHYVRSPLPTVVAISRPLWGGSFCHRQQTLARDT